MNDKYRHALEKSYLILLQIPHDSNLRLRALGALCACRDSLAELCGKSEQEIQETFEERALIQRIRHNEVSSS